MSRIEQLFSNLANQYDREANLPLTCYGNKPYLVQDANGILSFHTYNFRLFILIDQIFFGISFNLSKNISTLRGCVTELLSEIQSSQAPNRLDAVKNAVRTLVGTHAIAKKARKAAESVESEKTLIDIFQFLARAENKPIVQVALEFNCLEVAYELIQSDHSILAVDKKELQKLFKLCLDYRDNQLLKQLFALGVALPQFNSILKDSLFDCIKSQDEATLILLVENGLDCSIDSWHKSFASAIIEARMEDCLQKIIDTFQSQAHNENKPIVQVALENGCSEVAYLLIQRSQPFSEVKKKALRELFASCIEHRDNQLLKQLLVLGVTLPKDQDFLKPALVDYIKSKDETTLLLLIENGLDCLIHDYERIPFLVRLAEAEMSDCIQMIFDKNISTNHMQKYFFRDWFDLSKTISTHYEQFRDLINDTATVNSPNRLSTIKKSAKGLLCAYTITSRFQRSAEMLEAKNGLIEIFTFLAQSENKSIVQVALEFNCREIAYELIHNKNAFSNCSKDELRKLFKTCLDQEDHKLLQQLIEFEVPLPNNQSHLKESVFASISKKNEAMLISLVEHGLLCSIRDKNAVPFVSRVAEAGMHYCLQKLIDKKIDLQVLDRKANTVFHYAVQSLDIPLCQLLFPYVDVTARNNKGKTAIANLTFVDDLNAPPYKTLFIIDIINSIINKTKITGDKFVIIGNFLHIIGNFLHDKWDDTSSRAVFDYVCTELKKVFIPTSVLLFQLSHFSINSFQYSQGSEKSTPGDAPENIQVADLLDLFDSLNFTDVDGDDYFNPKPLLELANVSTIIDVRELLNKLYTNIRDKVAFDGTPKAGSPALEVFYDQIELHLKHVLKALKDKNDPASTLSILKEFILAAPKCGGRYYSVAVSQYLHICLGKKETPVSKLYQSLAEFRSLCLENAVSAVYSNYDHNVHQHGAVLRSFGQKYGILGHKQAEIFDDVYGETLKLEQIEAEFLKTYTPSVIITEWIRPLLETDGDFRESYLDWHKVHVPKNFEKDKFDKIFEKLDLLDSDEKISNLLKENHIFKQDDHFPRDAVKEERVSQYLSTVIYDEEGKLKVEGILSYLEGCKVITSGLKD